MGSQNSSFEICTKVQSSPSSRKPRHSQSMSRLSSNSSTTKMSSSASDARLAYKSKRSTTVDGGLGSDGTKSISSSRADILSELERHRLCKLVGLTAYQCQLLTGNWPKIYGTGSSQMGHLVMDDLSYKCSAAKKLLTKAQVSQAFSQEKNAATVMNDHSKWIIDLFDFAIKHLESPAEQLIVKCHEIGGKHRCLKSEGFNGVVWDSLSEVLLAKVRRNESVRKQRELSKGWTLLIVYVMERLKEGQQMNVSRSASTAVPPPPTTHPTTATSPFPGPSFLPSGCYYSASPDAEVSGGKWKESSSSSGRTSHQGAGPSNHQQMRSLSFNNDESLVEPQPQPSTKTTTSAISPPTASETTTSSIDTDKTVVATSSQLTLNLFPKVEESTAATRVRPTSRMQRKDTQ